MTKRRPTSDKLARFLQPPIEQLRAQLHETAESLMAEREQAEATAHADAALGRWTRLRRAWRGH